MNLYEAIIEQSKNIDWSDVDLSTVESLWFSVPSNHKRYTCLQKYPLNIIHLDKYSFLEGALILVDRELEKNISKVITEKVEYLIPTENSLKTLKEADVLIRHWKNKNYKQVVAIGGGVIINVATYIAEQLGVELVLIPSTIIAMSDAAIGGKVRMNDIRDGIFIKHAYKSFYEPSEIVLDPQFLNSITSEWIQIGLAEIIKHAVYQSPLLAEYLLSEGFDPFENKESLLRAILWTADLKRVCLEIDPEETKDGSYKILRAAHDLSDKMEECNEFKISHGKAVEQAMVEDLIKSDKSKYDQLVAIYKKLGIVF